MLFYLPRLLVMKTATPNLDSIFWHPASCTASSPRGSSVSLRYIATSRVPGWSAQELRRPRSRLPGHPEVKRALQMPASVTPRVRALAEEIVAGIRPDAFYDRARAVEAYLKGRYDYSLVTWAARAGVDPVEDFLFEHRRGHCEHFASAMAILLRSLGIPARVATGFSGGEWNDFGQFYTVRQRNAHAWVEAYIPAVRDWETFDPTPLGEAMSPPPTGLLAELDRRLAHLRLVWNSYVVNYSTQEQHDLRDAAVRLLARLSSVLPSLGRDLFTFGGGRGGGAGLLVQLGFLAALGVGAAFVVHRLVRAARRRRARPGGPGRPAVAFYRRMEAILRRRGFRRGAAETPREFAAAVVAQGGPAFAPAALVADAVGRVRYGGAALTPGERAEVASALARLAAAER
jgi:transglutaminase-like putative cysteine protease